MKGYNEGSLNVVTILHTDRPSPLIYYGDPTDKFTDTNEVTGELALYRLPLLQ